MRGVSKKMFISILTSVIVMVTMVATTFAWVGIFTYANTDSFQLNLKVSELDSNYFLTISSTGKKGTFSDNVPAIEVEKQVINSIYTNRYKDSSDEVIHRLFSNLKLKNVSTFLNDDETLSDFYSLNLDNTSLATYEKNNGYYDFDIYLSVDTKEGISEDTTGIRTNVLLTDIQNALVGTETSYRLLNENPFLELPSSSIYGVLNTLPYAEPFTIDSKSAVRFSLSLYDPINIDEEYTDEKPVKTYIYQGGTQLPTLDNDIYSLGGILEPDYNLASIELLYTTPSYREGLHYSGKLLEACENRKNDLELIEENSLIWDKDLHQEYLGCMDGVQTKMKINVRLWFEGWDADCIKAIEEKPVALNLIFKSNVID